MRDVIQKIITTEADARQRVQSAKAEAERILTGARKRADELKAAARQMARLDVDKLMAAALQTAEAERQERLNRAAAEIQTQVKIDKATAGQAAEAVVRCVCGFGQPTKGTAS